jgi:hypothetical protein
MKTYRITVELRVKDYPDLEDDDFIYRAIEEQLERGEDILDYDLEEVKPQGYICPKFEPMV